MTGPRTRTLWVAGVSLLVLGAANTWIGNSRMDDYRVRKQAAIAAGGPAVREPFAGTASILDPATDAQLLYESASIKYEYYRIVRRGGHYLLGVGAVLVLVAALTGRLRRARAQAT